ncbi:MAG: AraC family ligand binding domain-containing protein [Clostridia bacterium]|nr:AraC family ligand binding domain-containing protein [Clostridia bacterium]MDH7571970.1 AraC family ligand binding domain-containing protein [Clostridia bacterium]
MRVVDKPWGREIWWAHTDRYVGKILEVKAGQALSLQYHREKLESMYFWQGEGELRLGEETRAIRPGLAVTVLPGTPHRITAFTDLIIFEVSTPQVEDVVRLEDRYGRAEPTPAPPSGGE